MVAEVLVKPYSPTILDLARRKGWPPELARIASTVREKKPVDPSQNDGDRKRANPRGY